MIYENPTISLFSLYPENSTIFVFALRLKKTEWSSFFVGERLCVYVFNLSFSVYIWKFDHMIILSECQNYVFECISLVFIFIFFTLELLFANVAYVRNSIINRQFRYCYHYGALILILINIGVYMVTTIYPGIIYYLSMVPSFVHNYHWYWQFFTYMFVHANFSHLFSNMLSLLLFSFMLERAIGTKEFLLYYLLCGTLAGVASYFTYVFTGTHAILLGASGAVYAVLLLFAVAFPSSRIFLFGILPIRAPLLVLVYFIIEFFGQFAYDGVAHATHLFGMLFGYIYIRVRMRIKPLRVWGLL